MLYYIVATFIAFTTLPALAQSTEPSAEHFTNYVKLSEQSSAPDVETWLAELKASRPDYFSKYLVAYRSRSLQTSTPTAPRIILFSPQAELLIGFNGDPQERGYKNVETIAFDPATDRFEFHEGDFAPGAKPSLGKANPRKCLECHQSAARGDVDPRPNWEPYDKWPGFYGSLDDTVSDDDFKIESYLVQKFPNPADRQIVDEILAEKTNWPRFQAIRTASPVVNKRYALLDEIQHSIYNDTVTLNTPFTKTLSILSLRRTARLMTQDKEVFDFAKWNIAAFKRCNSLGLSKESSDFLKTRTPAPLTPLFVEGGLSTTHFSDMVAVFFAPFGINTEDWSTDFKTGGRFAFQERFGTPNETWTEFQQGFDKYFMNDPELKNADCTTLQAEALKRFGDVNAVKAFYEKRLAAFKPAPVKPLIQRCISCHVENAGVVPPIPFDDPAALKLALAKPGYKHGVLLDEIRYRLGSNATIDQQMPPAGVPTQLQKDDLLKYLSSL